MNSKYLFVFYFLAAVLLLNQMVRAGGHGKGEHVEVKIKYPVKEIKHTHTIYKTIHHYPKKEEHHDHDHHDFKGWHR